LILGGPSGRILWRASYPACVTLACPKIDGIGSSEDFAEIRGVPFGG
jgi:hypothetical protein